MTLLLSVPGGCGCGESSGCLLGFGVVVDVVVGWHFWHSCMLSSLKCWHSSHCHCRLDCHLSFGSSFAVVPSSWYSLSGLWSPQMYSEASSCSVSFGTLHLVQVSCPLLLC